MIRKCIILSSFITSLMLMGCSNKTITNLPSDFRQIDLLDKNKDVVKTYYQSFNDQIYEWINISCEFTKKKFKNINDCKLTEISKSILKKYKDSESPQNSNIDISNSNNDMGQGKNQGNQLNNPSNPPEGNPGQAPANPGQTPENCNDPQKC